MTASLFYIDAVHPGRVTVSGEEAQHASGSLRVRPGEVVLVCDGRGTLGRAEVLRTEGRSRLVLDVGDVVAHEQPRDICVVQAVPKGDHGDLAVDLLTQTGATSIVPWASARTVVDWKGKEQAKLERWRRVAKAASKQARRPYLPQIEDLCVGTPTISGSGFVLHEQAATSLFDVDLPQGPLTVVVGPEGGLSDDEVRDLQDAGAHPVNLGSQILRASSAGAAACVWIRGLDSRSEIVT